MGMRAELPQEVRNIFFFATFEFRLPFFSFPFACHIYPASHLCSA